MKFFQGATLVVVFLVLAYVAHDAIGWRKDAEIQRLEQSVDTAKAQRAAAIETVTVYVPMAAAAKARSDSADAQVDVVGDTLLAVHLTPAAPPALVAVPLPVTQDLITLRRTVDMQARTIAAFQAALAADSVVIRRQDSLIAVLRPSRCGKTCWMLIGAGSALGLRRLLQ